MTMSQTNIQPIIFADLLAEYITVVIYVTWNDRIKHPSAIDYTLLKYKVSSLSVAGGCILSALRSGVGMLLGFWGRVYIYSKVISIFIFYTGIQLYSQEPVVRSQNVSKVSLCRSDYNYITMCYCAKHNQYAQHANAKGVWGHTLPAKV